MKGAELPINVIIVVVLCLIILVAILVLVFDVFHIGDKTWGLENAKNSGCGLLLTTGDCKVAGSTKGIDIKNFDANKDGIVGESGSAVDDTLTACKAGGGGDDNLCMLCKCWYGVNDATCRVSICNCG